MASVTEMRLDLEDLKKLMSLASRSAVRDLLASEITRLDKEIQKTIPSVEQATAKPVVVTRTKIELYGWAQSDNFLTLYISDKIKDHMKAISTENVMVNFSDRSVYMEIKLENRTFYFEISSLAYPIIPEKSNFKVKADSIVLNLRKTDSRDWECVTAAEKLLKDKKQKERDTSDRDTKEDPSASLVNLMKKMYDEGDDEMKRMINKTWFESSQKQKSKDFGIGSDFPDM